MKILLCNFEYPPLGGGGGRLTALLARGLSRRHDVLVLTSQDSSRRMVELHNRVRILRVPIWGRRRASVATLPSMMAFMIEGLRYGRSLLRREPFDVILTHFVLPSGPVGAALSRYGGIPHVLCPLGGDLYDPSKWTSPHRHPLLRSWVRYLLGRADAVVTESSDILSRLRRYYCPEMEAFCVRPGLDPPPALKRERRRYGLDPQRVVLTFVGRLVVRKGIHQLLEVMRELRDLPVHLLLVGTGPEEARLRARARLLGVQQKVSFLGFLPEKEKFRVLQMSDIFVSASQHEGFGLTFLEAMACGLPVICYDEGGHRDCLVDGRTGYLVPLNDRASLAWSCRVLVQNAKLRRSMGEAARLRAREFSLEEFWCRYEAVLQVAVRRYARERALSPFRPPLPSLRI